MRPAAGRSRPMISRSSTDLPLPLPPITATICPRGTLKVTPSCTFCAPKRVTTESTSIAAAALICPSSCSRTANSASSRITQTMPCTTVEVVLMPMERASRLTVIPARQPMSAMAAPKIAPFARPTATCLNASCESTRPMKVSGEMSSSGSEIAIAPASAATSPTNTSSGSANTEASRRGSTSTCIGDRPRVRRASISSVSRIVPSCAVNAEPERPAMITATSSGAISREAPIATASTTKMLAPYFSACMPKRYASTMPMRKVTSATTGIASRHTCWSWAASSFQRRRAGWRASSPSAATQRPRNSRWQCSFQPSFTAAKPSAASGRRPARRGAGAPSPMRARTASITRAWLRFTPLSPAIVAPAAPRRTSSASAAAVSSASSRAPSSVSGAAGSPAAPSSASISAMRARFHCPLSDSVVPSSRQ